MRYYDFWNDRSEDDPALICPSIEPPFDNWQDPSPWKLPVPQPLVVELEEPGRLLPYYRAPFPIISENLLAAIRNCGVDNIQDYPVEIINPKDGSRETGYRALKIIGAIAAVDQNLSVGEQLDEDLDLGTFYRKVIIDESKTQGALVFRLAENLSYLVVAEKIKNALLAIDDSMSLRFSPLFESDLDDTDEPDPDLDYDDLGGDIDIDIEYD